MSEEGKKLYVNLTEDEQGRRLINTVGPRGEVRCRRISRYRWARIVRHLSKRPRRVEFWVGVMAILFREA